MLEAGRSSRDFSGDGQSRRGLILAKALAAFAKSGYHGTGIAEIAAGAAVSKAAVAYHFAAKDDLLCELAEPLMADMEALAERGATLPDRPSRAHELLSEYLDILLRHRAVASWVESDLAVLNHPVLGARLRRSAQGMRQALVGREASTSQRIAASAALGALWRPIRKLPIDVAEIEAHRDSLLAGAVAIYRAALGADAKAP